MSDLRCCLYCGRDTASRSQVCSRCIGDTYHEANPNGLTPNDIGRLYTAEMLDMPPDDTVVYRDYDGELPSDDI